MYYIGIYYDISPHVPSAYAVMEKHLTNLRRHYRVIDLNAFPSPCDNGIIHEKIIALHQDRSLFMVKKVFSQDRKPTKKVPSHPSVVCGFQASAPAPLAPVKKAGIPVDCLAFHEAVDTLSNKPNFTPGHDIHTSVAAVLGTLKTVIRQKRLDTERDALWNSLTMNDDALITHPDRHLVMAMAIPIWLAENVRKIYRY